MSKWIAGLLLMTMTMTAGERRAQDERTAAAMRATHVKTAGERAIVWAPREWPAEKRTTVTASLDRTITEVESFLGRTHDPKPYGQPHIEYFISDSDELPSHVYGAYEHSPSHGDRPYVFLSGLDSGEAPHIHETVHIVGGRFGSLLLREGVATYVQFRLQPGKMRPLVRLGDVSDRKSLDAAVTQLLARPENRALAAKWLGNPGKRVDFASRPERSLFYAVSASFSAFLIDRVGLEAVMRAYAADDPVAALPGWRQLSEEWLGRTG